MCGGKHGRQSHPTSRIRLTHVNRTVLDGHVLGALGNVLKSNLWFGNSEKEAAGTRPLTLYIVTCHKQGREGSQGPATPQQFLILV